MHRSSTLVERGIEHTINTKSGYSIHSIRDALRVVASNAVCKLTKVEESMFEISTQDTIFNITYDNGVITYSKMEV